VQPFPSPMSVVERVRREARPNATRCRALEGRLGHAAELSAALVLLASDASSYVTGITLPVEGGMLTS
jgi:NAD(P)-dependent dehydrogenase (short-subunit alcohol dehydrogenase family)